MTTVYGVYRPGGVLEITIIVSTVSPYVNTMAGSQIDELVTGFLRGGHDYFNRSDYVIRLLSLYQINV